MFVCLIMEYLCNSLFLFLDVFYHYFINLIIEIDNIYILKDNLSKKYYTKIWYYHKIFNNVV